MRIATGIIAGFQMFIDFIFSIISILFTINSSDFLSVFLAFLVDFLVLGITLIYYYKAKKKGPIFYIAGILHILAGGIISGTLFLCTSEDDLEI